MVAERLALDEVIQWDEGEYQHLKSLKRQKTKVENVEIGENVVNALTTRTVLDTKHFGN